MGLGPGLGGVDETPVKQISCYNQMFFIKMNIENFFMFTFVQELALTTGMKLDTESALEDLAPGDRGLLVDQILETQKEIENRDGAKKDLVKYSDDLWSCLLCHKNIDFYSFVQGTDSLGKSRETSKAEIEKLKNLLQECARNANPLGKLLDYVREDIDSMQKEVGKWREESRTLDSELEAAKR